MAEEGIWSPRTHIGKLVQEGKIASLDELFAKGYKIQESGIVDFFLPDLQQEVLGISLVQKQTDAGERSRFRAMVAVGNADGYVGVGSGKAMQARTAIEKAIQNAKMNIIPIRRGCGSWECDCKQLHSLPFRVEGRCGSVRIALLPGPRGLGLVASDLVKTILRLAGIKDCWTRARGSTRSVTSLALATFDALKNTYKMMSERDWMK